MKKVSLLLVCVIATIVSSDLTAEVREDLFKVQNQCMQESGATDEMVMNAYAGNFSDAPELAQQLVCVGKRNGIMDDAGHLHRDVIKEKFMMVINDEAKVDSILDKCMIEFDTIEATALAGAKCIFSELH